MPSAMRTAEDEASPGIGDCPLCGRCHRQDAATDPDTRRRILVVEDEPAIASLIAYNLEEAGFEVTTAADGLSAVEALESGPPHLVVLDLLLPLKSGWQVLRHLRGHSRPRLRDLPVVVVSALACERLARELAEEGAQHLLGKPFSVAELCDVARRLTDSPSLHAHLTGSTRRGW